MKNKSKKELIIEAQELADKLIEKKTIIEKIINDLDDSAEKNGVTHEHLNGMFLIEELFTEFNKIELEQSKIFEQIKKT